MEGEEGMCFVGTTITNEEKKLLQEEAARLNISLAELIRRKVFTPDSKEETPLSEVMDVKAAAEYLLVSVPTLSKMCLEKELPSFKMCGKYRLLKSDLDEYIQQERARGMQKRMKKQEHLPEFLTPSDVSNALKLSKMNVYKMIHSGELESVKVGRNHRIRAEVVEKMLSAG